MSWGWTTTDGETKINFINPVQEITSFIKHIFCHNNETGFNKNG